MSTLDPRIDAYIARSAEFAQPILRELRARVHAACPGVEETIKWGMPTFMHDGILCGMAAFKRHASFGYWKHALVVGEGEPRDGMGSYGKFTSLADLPGKRAMTAHLKRALQLNADGVKSPGVRKAAPRPAPETPPDLLAALGGNRAAKAAFDGFPPSSRREYIEWIVDAKRDATRRKRLAQAVEWMAEGKRRNWKYENC